MTTISSISKLRQNRNYIKLAESHKEQFGENQISISFFNIQQERNVIKEQFGENHLLISLFVNEIIQINGNPRRLPGDHLVFSISVNFI